MTNTINSVSPPRRLVGVWVMSVLNLLVSSVSPVLSSIASLFSGNNPLSLFDIAPALLQIGLGVAIAWTTVGAWQGKENYRKSFLILLVTFQVLQIASNLMILVVGKVPSQFTLRFIGAIVRSIFWIGINLWYFGRYETRKWYREMETFSNLSSERAD